MKNFNFEPIDFNEPKNIKEIEIYLDKDGEPGRFCGFHCLDKHYTHKDSGITDWTGFPASGKTYFLLEVLFNLSERYGKRHILYVPDLGTYKEIISKLIKMYSGKDFTSKYHNQIKIEEIYKHIPWLQHHFIILKRKDIKKPVTAIEFWEYVCDYSDSSGIAHTGIIDSWKNMFKDFKDHGREDLYLDYALSYRNELAEEYGKHFHTIAHATKTELDENNVQNGKKKRRIPDANDIKGGGSWFANGKSIITIDYPDKTMNGVDIYISKTKPEDVGKVGAVIGQVFLDMQRGRYYEYHNGEKRYGFDKEVKPTELTPIKDLLTHEEEAPW